MCCAPFSYGAQPYARASVYTLTREGSSKKEREGAGKFHKGALGRERGFTQMSVGICEPTSLTFASVALVTNFKLSLSKTSVISEMGIGANRDKARGAGLLLDATNRHGSMEIVRERLRAATAVVIVRRVGAAKRASQRVWCRLARSSCAQCASSTSANDNKKLPTGDKTARHFRAACSGYSRVPVVWSLSVCLLVFLSVCPPASSLILYGQD